MVRRSNRAPSEAFLTLVFDLIQAVRLDSPAMRHSREPRIGSAPGRGRRLAWALACGTITASLLPAHGTAQQMPASLRQFLQQAISLDQDQLAAATRGEPVVKTLETSDRREVVVFGLVRIDVPRFFYVREVADFAASLRAPWRRHFAIFSDPAQAADVAALALPHADVQDLAHCRPGSCNLKLSAGDIAALRARLDSGAARADSMASAYFRARFLDYVTGYRARGDSALIVYDDEQAATAAAQVFDAILSRSPFLYQYAPSLERYLKHYPQYRPGEVTEGLFWSEDDLATIKPILTITHQVVYAPPELQGVTLIAAKQLYADHYFDGGLDVTAVVDQAGTETALPAGIYVVLLRRLHFDELPSAGPINIRGKVRGKLRDQTTTLLRDMKAESERAYASPPGPSR